ncbi:MAG: DNA-O6-methylguanine--protein-cysteine S-methyltransferase /Transcriptional regulator Ada, partial [Bradyrhizobium sp.]|nr:DNA-O6-methylguanine--protein-cysteine S-methyltransferase /Transcriptional regulator Ada [Bradyrhizobium sp.]
MRHAVIASMMIALTQETRMNMTLTHETHQRVSQAALADDPRWARIVARDRTADGHLWYSVLTTGVYCRPSCPSRIANPRNVLLHDTFEEAKATGFRPCKRCNPDGVSAEAGNVAIVARACRLIEESEKEPSLADLAAAVGRSPSYFHRRFKAVTGLTPKDYAVAHRASKVRESLASGNSVTEAIYDAGFNSSGRFYEKSTGMLGMTPSQYRTGGANEEIRFAVGETSLGAILVASSKKGVASILLGDDPNGLVRELQDRFPKAHLIGADRNYEALVARVVGFIETPQLGLDLPLDVRGTAFQQRVWQALQGIPIGQTVSYTEIARRIGSPDAVRAVAGACA